MIRFRGAVIGLALALTVGCSTGSDEPEPAPSPGPSIAESGDAVSTPVEDRVYPDVGDPGVDAQSYHLDLAWDRTTRSLTATEQLEFRATADAPHFQLDLGPPLQVDAVRVDGHRATWTHRGKDLVVDRPVRADQRYVLLLRYSGTPRPVPAPTKRSDFDSTGWTITDDGEVWTMQEPYGAYSWYAVNDQPSDKALYSFTIRAPAPWVGVANGELTSRTRAGGDTVTEWRLDQPASSYVVTIAIGDFTMTQDASASGVPITYWTPPDRPHLLEALRAMPAALDWVEKRLGPYPFESLGALLVDSRSGMETQTMLTLGATAQATAPEVLVHEIVHQWYGDLVTPVDWRDVWMNEGMATYLQGVFETETAGEPLTTLTDQWAAVEPQMRAEAGPPADYDPAYFASGNVYYSPALMWDAIRRQLGDDEFWQLVRDWPANHRIQNADYDDITSWWSEQSGEDLQPTFDAWLLGATSPTGG